MITEKEKETETEEEKWRKKYGVYFPIVHFGYVNEQGSEEDDEDDDIEELDEEDNEQPASQELIELLGFDPDSP